VAVHDPLDHGLCVGIWSVIDGASKAVDPDCFEYCDSALANIPVRLAAREPRISGGELPVGLRGDDAVGGLTIHDGEMVEEPRSTMRDDPRVLARATWRQATRWT
jgi:hypothetical protein